MEENLLPRSEAAPSEFERALWMDPAAGQWMDPASVQGSVCMPPSPQMDLAAGATAVSACRHRPGVENCVLLPV